LIGPSGVIYSIDKDRFALAEQERLLHDRFPNVTVHYLAADFTRPLQLPPLDGIVMANALHFQRDKDRVVQLVRTHLKPGGRLMLVEYNIGSGNFAVPHPIPFRDWQTLARRSGFAATKLLATRPSRFLKEIYSAVSW
jgi:SAM-dependent methyltransferase